MIPNIISITLTLTAASFLIAAYVPELRYCANMRCFIMPGTCRKKTTRILTAAGILALAIANIFITPTYEMPRMLSFALCTCGWALGACLSLRYILRNFNLKRRTSIALAILIPSVALGLFFIFASLASKPF